MTDGTTERTIETHMDMLVGGTVTAAVAGLTLGILIAVGAASDKPVDLAWAVLAGVCVIVGAAVILTGVLLRHVDKGRAELMKNRAEQLSVDSGVYEELRLAREARLADDAARARNAEVLDRFLEHEAVVDKESEKARTNLAGLRTDVTSMRAEIAGLRKELGELHALLAIMRQESPPARVIAQHIAALDERVEAAVERLAVVEERTGAAYTVGFADGATTQG